MSRAFGIGQIDSIVALAAACMLAFGAWRIGKGAWDSLMDRRADPALSRDITRSWPGTGRACMAFTI
jgi:ferrous-iron efflux pump FieF